MPLWLILPSRTDFGLDVKQILMLLMQILMLMWLPLWEGCRTEGCGHTYSRTERARMVFCDPCGHRGLGSDS